MHDPAADRSPDPAAPADTRYRTVTFETGPILHDREDTSRWIHADGAVPSPPCADSALMPVGNASNRCRLIMSMGNYMSGTALFQQTMAATTPAVGIDHPTVRPRNFDPEADDDAADAADSEQ